MMLKDSALAEVITTSDYIMIRERVAFLLG